jgi:Skp family chaperone for outer membrane proteins
LLDAANDQAISSDERDKRKQAAADKYTEIQSSQTAVVQFERQAQATLAAQTQRMRTDIIQEITTVVTTKAKAASYTMVIDMAAQSLNQTPVLMYNDDQNDLTAAVLAQLNAGAPIDLTPAASVVPPLTISTNSP